jgi:anti-sigma factor RsiW
MDCTQTRDFIECYADGELDAITSAKVEQHLHTCATCQRSRDALHSLRTLVKNDASYYRAPDRLVRQIHAPTVAKPGNEAKSAAAWWNWWRPAALVVVTAAVTWTVASLVDRPSEHQPLAGEVIAGHARSTLTGHVTDVASSERHTVKPWLSSKLDFSPPVTDLASAGFPLLGGRLDYVNQRPVAVLVYGRRKHVINLFVWPTKNAPDAVGQNFSRQGYQVRNWTRGDMTFWAVSDLNAAELQTFAEKFADAK